MSALETVAATIASVMLVFFFFMLFIFFPAHAMNEEHCLELGYPEVRTTITLKGYCVSISEVVPIQR
jgi:hypothetical protein